MPGTQELEILEWRPFAVNEEINSDMIELEPTAGLLGSEAAEVGGYFFAEGPGSIGYVAAPISSDDIKDIDQFESENASRGRCCGYARIPYCTGRMLVRMCIPTRCVWYTLRYRCRHGHKNCLHTIRVHCR